MALAKDPISAFHGNNMLGDVTSYEHYKFEEGDSFEFRGLSYHPQQQLSSAEDTPPSINFKGGAYDAFLQGTNGSVLCFEQNEKPMQSMKTGGDYLIWEGGLNHNNSSSNNNQVHLKGIGADARLVEDFNCFETSSNGDWLYSDAAAVTDSVQDSGSPEAINLKRPRTGESNQAMKKQSTNEAKKAKSKSAGAAKDPQSVAAKNRRERISERLKILQELVPNGSKVDLVTMLEKAIGYVKFLQLQVKVLATDEFWPVQGGKAPDISQVREAIDAILSSQNDRKSSSQ